MDQIEAFAIAKRTMLENLDAEVVDENFDEEYFGDFYVSFRLEGRKGSILTDRGQMFICDDLRGGGKCKMLFPNLRQVGQQELVSILVSLFRDGRW